MKRIDRRRTRQFSRRQAAPGQAFTELALIVPLLAIMLLGIVEVAGAYGTQINVRNAAYQAARVGALLGNGGQTSFTCPTTTSSITDTVDTSIVKTVLGMQGVNSSNISSIQVYKAGVNAGTIAYSGTTPLLNQYVSPFISGANLIASAYNWPSCLRNSSEPADALGVHLTYRYHPITPLFSMNTVTLDNSSVVRLNPTQADNPCPVPQAPTDVAAHWAGTEPSTSDALTWTAVLNATSYKIYAGVNGSAVGNTPVYTVTSPPSSGSVTASYTYNPPFPAASQISYQVKANNYCGDGDISDPVPDGQYALPITPTIITATAAVTPGNDYLSWTSVPDAQSYTITQTANTGNQAVYTVAAPLTSTVVQDLYHNPPVSSVTYAVAATSRSTVAGPSATAVITTGAAPLVTIDDAVTTTAPTTNTFTYGGTGNQWVQCGPTTTGPTRCSATTGVLASGLYSNTLSLSPHTNDTMTIPFTGTQITLYGVMQPNSGKASIVIDGVTVASAVDFYAGTAVGNTPVYTSTTLGAVPAAHTLTLTVLGQKNGSSSNTYIGIDRAVVQQ